MNSWATGEQLALESPLLISSGMGSPPVSLSRQIWGHFLVFFKNLNGKRNIQQFLSSRCGSIFDRADCRSVGLCTERHRFTHLSRKAIWSNKNPNRSWQPPGCVGGPQPKLSGHQVKELSHPAISSNKKTHKIFNDSVYWQLLGMLGLTQNSLRYYIC